MLLTKLYGENFLSFGEKGPDLTLAPLNVLIGANGSGKSNFIELISIFRSFSDDTEEALRKAGGFSFLLSNKLKHPSGFSVSAEFSPENLFFWTEVGRTYKHSAEIWKDGIHEECFFIDRDENNNSGKILVNRSSGQVSVFKESESNKLKISDSRSFVSIFSFLGFGSEIISEISSEVKSVKIYRDYVTGRSMPARWPQPADAKNDFLDEDTSNLGLVLNSIRQHPKEKRKLLDYLKRAYEGITDFNVLVQGNTVQIFLEEGDVSIPATRLSDGTIHYLCLLAILCHPKPPALICIEEPEVGLHPDMMRTIAELLVDASQRTQLIVTTHSDALIDALSDHPEYVVVCEKQDGVTQMRRLEPDKLKVWLEKYSLGQLWTRGDIGGTRW